MFFKAFLAISLGALIGIGLEMFIKSTLKLFKISKSGFEKQE